MCVRLSCRLTAEWSTVEIKRDIKWVLVRSTNTGKWMSIVLPISCCRYNPRERAVYGGPPSPNTNALSLRPTPDRRCDRQETDHARTTNCHPLVQQRVKRVHPPSFHYTRTYIHMHTHTHAHTVTQTHAGYECTLSSFLVSLPVKIPSQFLCSGTPHQSLVRLSPFHPLSTA